MIVLGRPYPQHVHISESERDAAVVEIRDTIKDEVEDNDNDDVEDNDDNDEVDEVEDNGEVEEGVEFMAPFTPAVRNRLDVGLEIRRRVDAAVLARSRIACYNTRHALEVFAVGGLVSVGIYREDQAKTASILQDFCKTTT